MGSLSSSVSRTISTRIPRTSTAGDFGAPDFAFLTHLHNGHTAPESDGKPHYMQINEGGYVPGDWVDNLYLNYPAGGDEARSSPSLVPRPPHAPHRRQRLQRHGRDSSPYTTRSWILETRPRGCACPASGLIIRMGPSTSSTISRWPSMTAPG